MKSWPLDFADLLNDQGRALLEQPAPLAQFAMDNRDTPYVNLRELLTPQAEQGCLALLEQRWPIMQRHREENPLRAADQCDPDLDYVSSPYNSRLHHMFCPIGSREGDEDFRQFFLDSGLFDMCRSDSMRRFAEAITGYRLLQNQRSGVLVICYGANDYLSMHNDVKWPMQAGWVDTAEPIAYVDLHLSFVTDAAEQQFLLIQQGAYVNRIMGGKPVNGTVSVYRLPFWHFATPLIPKAGEEERCRRWIVMVNYEILGDNRPKILC
jgi:hypothetical protein